jgi:hypothetical protein
MRVLQQPSSPGGRVGPTDRLQPVNSSSLGSHRVRRCLHRQAACVRARAAPSGELQEAAATAEQADADRLASSQEAFVSGNGAHGAHEATLSVSNGAHSPELCSPEDLVLEPGDLSHIDRSSPLDPADVFRCSGCLEEACQVIRHISTKLYRLLNGPSVRHSADAEFTSS